MTKLIDKACGLLEQMYDPDSGLFSYSARIVGSECVNDFSHPKKQRYTINTLAGLWKLRELGNGGWNFENSLEDYLRCQFDNVTDPGDKGLLLYVLALSEHPAAASQFEKVKTLVATDDRFSAHVLQDACWLLYGLIAFANKFDNSEAEDLAHACFRVMLRKYFDKNTHLPYHAVSGPRKRFVSFGGITYFLKLLDHYASAFGSSEASELFEGGVDKIISLQGQNGEWAWFYDAVTGNVVDWYEVYSVHQEAMAMLFLLPAHDRDFAKTEGAINKSVNWLFGDNELHAQIMVDEPFFSFRSIRRRGTLQREKRILRAFGNAILGRSAAPAAASDLEINTECRSYEMGWTVYAWAGRDDFQDFTSLRRIESQDQNAR